MPRTTSALRWGGLLPLVGLLAACGYFSGAKPSAAVHPPAQAPQALDPTAKALAAMVDAVGPSTSEVPIELRFSIRERPQVGQDDEVDYALVPQVAGIESVRIVFGAFQGLEVTDRGPAIAALKPASGVPIFGSVTIRPVETGLFTLTAAVGLVSPSQSVTWPFRIPIIVAQAPGQASAQAPAQAAAP